MRIGWTIAILCGATLTLGAADEPAPILAPAAKVQTAQVKALLDRGADIEAKDRNGRTPLMLAAQRGRVETVRLLMARGAKTETRDREGNTAFMLAQFSPAGRGDHEGVIRILPKPPRPKVALDVTWSPARLASSCYLSREQLVQTVEAIHLDDILLRDLAAYMRTSVQGLVELVGESPDVTAKIEIQPGAACSAPSGDNLTFNIDLRLLLARDGKIVFQKNFGGGVKGLRVQTVSNAAQYAPVFQSWVKPQPEPISWAIAEEAYRYTPQQ